MARKLKVWVDHQACVGNAMCESIAPKVLQAQRRPSVRGGRCRGGQRREDPRGGGKLPGECDLRGGCGDRGAVVSVGLGGCPRVWWMHQSEDVDGRRSAGDDDGGGRGAPAMTGVGAARRHYERGAAARRVVRLRGVAYRAGRVVRRAGCPDRALDLARLVRSGAGCRDGASLAG